MQELVESIMHGRNFERPLCLSVVGTKEFHPNMNETTRSISSEARRLLFGFLLAYVLQQQRTALPLVLCLPVQDNLR